MNEIMKKILMTWPTINISELTVSIVIPASNDRCTESIALSLSLSLSFSFLLTDSLPLTPLPRMSRLVTRRNASRGDLLKKFGDKFGGKVNGFREAEPESHARFDTCT